MDNQKEIERKLTAEDLLPCPFCGQEVTYYYVGTGSYEIHSKDKEKGCLFCDDGVYVTHGGFVSTDEQVVIKAWNTRKG